MTAMQAPTFHDDDEAARYYLTVLRDGSEAEKIVARAGLAIVFERRNMFDEAVELYERNIQAGARTPELFLRLSHAYRRLGHADRADAALAEARRLHAERGTAPDARRVIPFPTPAHAEAEQAPAASPTPPVAGRDTQTQAPRPAGVVDDAYADTARLPTQSPDAVASGETAGRALARPGPASLESSAPTDAATEPARDGAVDDLPSEGPYETDAVASAEPSSETTARRAGLLAIAGLGLLMIVLPVALLSLLVVNPVALYLEGKAAGPTIDAHAETPAQLKIVPGWTASWYLRDGRSVTGLWSTPGLDLTIDEGSPGAGLSFTVTPALPQPWGETITVVERRGEGRTNQETTIPASFQVPADLPTGSRPPRAHISGAVTAPRMTDAGQFATTSDAIDRPVELVVVSVPELLLDRFVNSVSMYTQEDRWLLVTIGALLCWCVLAGAIALIARLRR